MKTAVRSRCPIQVSANRPCLPHPPTTALAGFVVALFTSWSAEAVSLPATAVGTLRDQTAPFGSINIGDGFFSYLHMANNYPAYPVEDRGFAEFNLTTVVGTPVAAELVYTITSTIGGFAPIGFDLYGYAGDGVVSYPTANLDFNAGTYLTSFTITSQPVGSEIHVDVLSFLLAQWLADEAYVGFNLRAQPSANSSRWAILGHTSIAGSLPELELTTEVPEAAHAGAGAGLGLLGLLWLRARHRTVR